MRRFGVLGGTFDPIHNGHLAIAEEARWALRLERVYMVPAAQQPLKQERHMASPQQRLDMLRLACTHNPGLVPCDLELRRGAPSYTVDTLREIRILIDSEEGSPTPHNEIELWFILGGDALLSLPRWYAARQIIELACLAVVKRPGVALDLTTLDEALPGLQMRTDIVEGPGLDIASTDLRQRIARGQPVRYQLPDSVLGYIIEQELYRPTQTGGSSQSSQQ
jgi:nicotinate-nucleotide adenylyltransferase